MYIQVDWRIVSLHKLPWPVSFSFVRISSFQQHSLVGSMKRSSSIFLKAIESTRIFNRKKRKLQTEGSGEKIYPSAPEQYELMEEISKKESTTVYKAKCFPLTEIVAIKCFHLNGENADLGKIEHEIKTLKLLSHPNLLIPHRSFLAKQCLWQVMPFMAGGSLKSILSFKNIFESLYPVGLQESVIATVLKDVLKGLDYLHKAGHIHRDVKAGNILLHSDGSVKLTGFGSSTVVSQSGDENNTGRRTFAGTISWMAPEVLFADDGRGYDYKADIWSFGITAMELAHGRPPFCEEEPMRAISQLAKGIVPIFKEAKFSKAFKEMVGMCLVQDPQKRPSAKKLLRHAFFKQQAKTCKHVVVLLLDRLPTLTQRLKIMREDTCRRIIEAMDPPSSKDVRRIASFSEVMQRMNEASMEGSRLRRNTI